MATPLAWKNLTHDKPRLAVVIAGIGFAVLLMFMQTGFQNALFDSQVRLVDVLRGDLFLMSPARFALAAEKRFPRGLLTRAQSLSQVKAAAPLYAEFTRSVLKRLAPGRGAKGYPIRTFGVRPSDQLFSNPQLQQSLALLNQSGTALFDVSGNADRYDLRPNDGAPLEEQRVELASQELRLVGPFRLGADFVHDGNLIMTIEDFARYFPTRNPGGAPLDLVDLGVVSLAEGADPLQVAPALQELLGDGVRVLTPQQLRLQEQRYWDRSTPIGAVFLAGKLLGFIVGMVICYQIIHQDISDHLAEFATLKAMGYGDGYFLRFILHEAGLLSVLGFVPGALVSLALYYLLAEQTGLLMRMTPQQAAMVYGLTLAMCAASGVLAVRKLRHADPASLF